jgi:nitroimidazol reductase NimA-like FMN-containing flavoprotein (pyridoxamine 5'-phosphate oxidase superfamily)
MEPGYLEYLETSSDAAPSPGTVARLAAALGVSMAALAGAGLDAAPGSGPPGAKSVLETLTEAECRAHLGEGGVGRFLFLESRGPVAVPVNYRLLDGGDIVFRTAHDTSLVLRAPQTRVSFEVDRLDEALAEGWSVLLSGTAHVVGDQGELEAVTKLGVAPWAGGTRDTYIRISPERITGRRLRGAPDPGR